ncbi:hypothetical protein ACSQ67_018042 [Phaseolus vulgaris]
MAHDEDRLRLYSNKLFDRAYATAFLSNVEARDRKKLKTKESNKPPNSNKRLSASVPRLIVWAWSWPTKPKKGLP